MTEPTHRRLKGIFRSLGRKKTPKTKDDTQEPDCDHSAQDQVSLEHRPKPGISSTVNGAQSHNRVEAPTTTSIDVDGPPVVHNGARIPAHEADPPGQPLLPVPEELPTSAISSRLWNKAYDNLKEKEAELVDTYERLLSQQLVAGKSENIAPPPQSRTMD